MTNIDDRRDCNYKVKLINIPIFYMYIVIERKTKLYYALILS